MVHEPEWIKISRSCFIHRARQEMENEIQTFDKFQFLRTESKSRIRERNIIQMAETSQG